MSTPLINMDVLPGQDVDVFLNAGERRISGVIKVCDEHGIALGGAETSSITLGSIYVPWSSVSYVRLVGEVSA